MFRVRVSVTLGKAGKTTPGYTTVYNVRQCHVTDDIVTLFGGCEISKS
jgi:hypothetical protein